MRRSRTAAPERSRRGPLVLAPLLLLLAGGPAPGSAAEAKSVDPRKAEAQAQAERVVRETLDEVIAVLKDDTLSVSEKRRRTEEIAYARFDFEKITRLILARNRKKLSAEQQAEFGVEFRRHLSLTYGDNLQNYRDEQVSIERSRLNKSGRVTVFTRVSGRGADPIRVTYLLHLKDKEWRVIGLKLGSLSLITNFRTQVQEIISQDGIDHLIQHLREKNEARATES